MIMYFCLHDWFLHFHFLLVCFILQYLMFLTYLSEKQQGKRQTSAIA